VREYMITNNLTLIGLQAMFEKKVLAMLKTITPTRTSIVWQEAFETIPEEFTTGPALNGGTIIEIWYNSTILEEALDAGFDCILANGWYLDRQVPVDDVTTWFWGDTAWEMYLVDPENASATPFPPDDGVSQRVNRGRILGGEANMWSEQVSALNIEQRIWPRACTIAERLWSPNTTRDMGSAAQRLGKHRCRMAYRGLPVGPIWSDYCGADLSLEASSSDDSSKIEISEGVLAGIIIGSAIGGMLFIGCILCIAKRLTADISQGERERFILTDTE